MASTAAAPPLPTNEAVLAAVRSTPGQHTLREVYLLAIGRNPKSDQMESGMKQPFNQQLYALAKAGAIQSFPAGKWAAANMLAEDGVPQSQLLVARPLPQTQTSSSGLPVARPPPQMQTSFPGLIPQGSTGDGDHGLALMPLPTQAVSNDPVPRSTSGSSTLGEPVARSIEDDEQRELVVVFDSITGQGSDNLELQRLRELFERDEVCHDLIQVKRIYEAISPTLRQSYEARQVELGVQQRCMPDNALHGRWNRIEERDENADKLRQRRKTFRRFQQLSIQKNDTRIVECFKGVESEHVASNICRAGIMLSLNRVKSWHCEGNYFTTMVSNAMGYALDFRQPWEPESLGKTGYVLAGHAVVGSAFPIVRKDNRPRSPFKPALKGLKIGRVDGSIGCDAAYVLTRSVPPSWLDGQDNRTSHAKPESLEADGDELILTHDGSFLPEYVVEFVVKKDAGAQHAADRFRRHFQSEDERTREQWFDEPAPPPEPQGLD